MSKIILIFLGDSKTVILKEDSMVSDTDLKSVLDKNKISDKSAYLLLPRHKVVIKNFDLPMGDEEEIDKMVRFQLEKELPIPLENVNYTYRTRITKDKVKTQCIVVQKEIVQVYSDQLKSCSIKTDGFLLTTYALAEMLPKEGVQTLICKMDNNVELIVTKDGALEFTHSIAVHDKKPSDIAEEINRAITSYKAQGGELISIKLLSDSVEIKESVEKLLSVHVEDLKIDPYMACLSSASKNLERLPDLSKAVRVRRKIKLPATTKLVISVCSLVAILVVALNVWATVEEDKVKQFKKENDSSLTAIRSLEKLHKVSTACSKWQDKQVDWFLSLLEFTLKLDTKIVYLTSLSYNEESNVVILSARAKNQDDVLKVLNSFKGMELMELDEKNQPSVQHVDKDPFGFKFQFSVNLKVK